MKEKKEKRGGARKGAGAKSLAGVNRVTLGCTVHPDTLAYIKGLAVSKGLSVGLTIDEIIKEKIMKDMEILDYETIERIRRNYPHNWAEAMTNVDNARKVLQFMKRASAEGISLTYEQAYFASRGVEVWSAGEEERIFSVSFNTAPLTERDAEGDWQKWLKEATLVKKIVGWNNVEG